MTNQLKPWEVVERESLDCAGAKSIEVTEHDFVQEDGSTRTIVSMCFTLANGRQKFIPLSRDSELEVGDKVDPESVELITLERDGEKINRVDGESLKGKVYNHCYDKPIKTKKHNIKHSDINTNTYIDENWTAYKFLQKAKNTISKFNEECGKNYPMILIPSELSIVFNKINDDDRFTRISDIMDNLIIKYGRNKDIIKQKWDLYRWKPYEPSPYIPKKKSLPQKRIIETFTVEKEEVTKPNGCITIYLILFLLLVVIGIIDNKLIWLSLYLLLFLPTVIVYVSRSKLSYTKTVYKKSKKTQKK